MARRILIIMSLFMTFLVNAQDRPDFVTADSVTYSYYLQGKWDSLIRMGTEMISENVDYKYLRQRLGYAFFAKEDYTAAKKNFRKALKYDSYNAFTNEYLFYSFLNTGKVEHAGWVESRMDADLALKAGVTRSKLIDAIDAEFNYKASGSSLRTGALYYRFGLGTKLGWRLRLYQCFSEYNQTVTLLSSAKFGIRQAGYYARLGWNVSRFTVLTGAYHLVRVAGKGNRVFNGHLFLAGLSPDLNRFIFETNASLFRYEKDNSLQMDIHAGYIFPGSSAFYLKATGAIIRNSSTTLVTGISAGSRVSRKTWLDMDFLTGNMDRYNDFRGVYVYNSYDPLIMRSGATLNFNAGSRVALWINFSLERKKYYEDFNYRYNQYSYLAGIRWKI